MNKKRVRFLSNVLLPAINLATTIYNGSLDFRTIAMATASCYSVANAIRSTYARLLLLKKIKDFKNEVLTSKNEEKIAELVGFINDKKGINIDKIMEHTKRAENRIATMNILKTIIGDKTFNALKNIVKVRKLKEQGKVNDLP